MSITTGNYWDERVPKVEDFRLPPTEIIRSRLDSKDSNTNVRVMNLYKVQALDIESYERHLVLQNEVEGIT